MSSLIRVSNSLLKLQRTQSVPIALYHANVSAYISTFGVRFNCDAKVFGIDIECMNAICGIFHCFLFDNLENL